MKTFLYIAFFTYVLLFAVDYISARRNANRQTCEIWLSYPWQIHLLMPGTGNACLDMGYWFKEKK